MTKLQELQAQMLALQEGMQAEVEKETKSLEKAFTSLRKAIKDSGLHAYKGTFQNVTIDVQVSDDPNAVKRTALDKLASAFVVNHILSSDLDAGNLASGCVTWGGKRSYASGKSSPKSRTRGDLSRNGVVIGENLSVSAAAKMAKELSGKKGSETCGANFFSLASHPNIAVGDVGRNGEFTFTVTEYRPPSE